MSSQTGTPLATSQPAPWQDGTLPNPEAAYHAPSATNGQNPLDAWPNRMHPQAGTPGQTSTSPALSILAYEKVLLDRVSPTTLRHQAITALLNAPNLQVDVLSDSVLIAIVLDTLHHSGRVRHTAREFIRKFASDKVVLAYEAVLADLRANRGPDQEHSKHQDRLARLGLEMYYTYGEQHMQHMAKPTAESHFKLAQAIAPFQKAWALRTLAAADQQHLFLKALYGWAKILEDRAWMEQDARGMPNTEYTQKAQVKYQEFLKEARKYKDRSQAYPDRAHLYHAESHQANPTQRGSLRALAWRILSLTGSFETGKNEPNNFAGLAGNFDGQGLSFGALQWNIGQRTLPTLLREIDRQQGALVRSAFGSNYKALRNMLTKSKKQQLTWAKSIQNAKFVLHRPWRKAFKTLGTQYDFQKIQVEHAHRLFKTARKLCDQYQVRSERAVALMFDILVQNGGVRKTAKTKILKDFQALRPTGNAAQDEVARLRIIAKRVAEASNAKWVADVRRRKLTIANGTGKVHGKPYNLADRNISLKDYETGKPLDAAPAAPPLVNQAGLQS
ncbi:hypothetical protein [Candidatus Entotheonella palauensis]|uniref:Uncharacterized protein n=1 Tax=Candidatus Entotheonella gemina TaxID=1429439 RepID=W4MF93_9BACT|nr:hypothetical protein [Candidatus Entotheonella palauensis]ETX08873.1 MAG: hypothetical protein ETSY2_02845 [Candidatus Entotheonella gemina]